MMPRHTREAGVALPNDNWMARVRTLTLQFVKQASVNGTRGEAAFAPFLRDLLAQHPYFKQHPDDLWLEPIPGDALGRANVIALVRGSGARTILLTGHFDVVGVANYGDLEPWAFDPEELLPRLVKTLEQKASSEEDELALADLKSGNYLPGRGVLDMKTGLAVGVAVLERFAETKSRGGNLLFIASPDEENRSSGIRAAAARLAQIERERGLRVCAAINLDATSDRGDGRDGQAVYLGSVGKYLVSVFLVGREAHASYPFDGVNAALLAAEVVREFECNADVADFTEGEAAPPPTTLKLEDLKQHYDVTTPGKAWCCFNVLTHGVHGRIVLARSVTLVRECIRTALRHQERQFKKWTKAAARKEETERLSPLVLTFAELRRKALARGGETLQKSLTALENDLRQQAGLDLPSASRRLTEFLWDDSGLSGPAAVVGFGSLPYPCVLLGSDRETSSLRSVIEEEMISVAAHSATSIRFRNFFAGISDMSFLGRIDKEDLQLVAANTPPWNPLIQLDVTHLPELPVINIGPWGRDYHKHLERVHMPYSFEVLPELVWRVSTSMVDE